MNLICSLKCTVCWAVLAALFFGGSFLFTFWGVQKIIRSQIISQTALIKDTDQWDRFLELPFPVSFVVRFFEPINIDGILYNNEKPILNESKPYIYKLYIKKENLRYDDDEEDSVNYNRNMIFEFDNSSETLDTDEITIINPILLASLQLSNNIERLALAGCLEKLYKPDLKPEIFISVQVKKFLFDGLNFAYANDTDLGVACNFVRTKMISMTADLRNIEHIDEGDGNDYLRFTVFNYKTQNYAKYSPDGRFTINRGQTDINQLGQIIRWSSGTLSIDGTSLNIWGTRTSINNESCAAIKGTDSTIYKPQIEENENIYVYNTDICRSVQLEYKGNRDSYNGLQAYRYEAPDTIFKSSTNNPENDCFCTKSTRDINNEENCYLNGVVDFKPCIGSPILVAQPHFLNADNSYLEMVDGLSPDKESHGIYLLLEPNTGTPLKARKRMQLNCVLKKESLLSSITPQNMTEVVFPFLWLEEGADLPQKYVDMVQNQYFDKVKLAHIISYVLIGVSTGTLTICVFFLLRKACVKTNPTV